MDRNRDAIESSILTKGNLIPKWMRDEQKKVSSGSDQIGIYKHFQCLLSKRASSETQLEYSVVFFSFVFLEPISLPRTACYISMGHMRWINMVRSHSVSFSWMNFFHIFRLIVSIRFNRVGAQPVVQRTLLLLVALAESINSFSRIFFILFHISRLESRSTVSIYFFIEIPSKQYSVQSNKESSATDSIQTKNVYLFCSRFL